MKAEVLKGPMPKGASHKDICGCQQAMRAAAEAEAFSKKHLANLATVELKQDTETIAAPTIIQTMTHFPYGVGVRFSHSGGIDSFIYEVLQNGVSVRHPQAMLPNCRATQFLHKKELKLQNEVDQVEFRIYAQKGDQKSAVTSVFVSIEPKKLKQKDYEFKYKFNNEYSIDGRTGELVFDGGWTPEEMAIINSDFKKANEHYKKRFDNPMSNIPFEIVRYVGSNVAFKIPEAFQLLLHPPKLNPSESEEKNRLRLNSHEYGHGWWCPANASVNRYFNYSPFNSWCEEGLAEMESRHIAGTLPWYHNLYDLYNTVQLRMDSFFKMTGGMGEPHVMYGCAATAWDKINFSNTFIIPRFWCALAKYLNEDQDRYIDYDVLVKCLKIACSGTLIEGLDFDTWFSRQHVFHPEKGEGLRMFTNIQYGFYHEETICKLEIFFYEDEIGWFTYGPDFELIRHKVNGLDVEVYLDNAYSNLLIDNYVGKTKPEKNPPQTNDVAAVKIVLTTKNVLDDSFIKSDHYKGFKRIYLGDENRKQIKVKAKTEAKEFNFDFLFGKIQNSNIVWLSLKEKGICQINSFIGGIAEEDFFGNQTNYMRMLNKSSQPQLLLFEEEDGIKEKVTEVDPRFENLKSTILEELEEMKQKIIRI